MNRAIGGKPTEILVTTRNVEEKGADPTNRNRAAIYIVCLAMACLAAFASRSAVADTLVYAIAKVQAEDEGIKEKIKDAQDKASKAKVERDALVQDYQKIKSDFDAVEARYHDAVETFNQNCAGKPMSTPGCASLNNAANTEEAAARPRAEQLQQQGAQLATKVQGALSRAVLADTEVKKLINYESQLQAAIARMKVKLASQCTGVSAYSSLEDMKSKCGNVQFDGAPSDLPPCTTDRCLQYDSLAH